MFKLKTSQFWRDNENSKKGGEWAGVMGMGLPPTWARHEGKSGCE